MWPVFAVRAVLLRAGARAAQPRHYRQRHEHQQAARLPQRAASAAAVVRAQRRAPVTCRSLARAGGGSLWGAAGGMCMHWGGAAKVLDPALVHRQSRFAYRHYARMARGIWPAHVRMARAFEMARCACG